MATGAEQKGILKAYQEKDAEASKALHQKKASGDHPDHEKHKSFGDFVKSIIYGGLDAIVTTFAIVASIRGGSFKPQVAIAVGFAKLVADGLSMGVGDYLSETAEIDYANAEKSREKWELENNKELEIQEMLQIYKEKHGVSEEDAEIMIRTMAKYEDFFLDHMLVEELELQPPSGDEEPFKQGMVTLGSFIVFGMIPLVSYIVFSAIPWKGYNPEFIISIILTLMALFGLGWVKAKMSNSNPLKSGCFIMINGAIAAIVSYFISWGLSELTDASAH